jgi:hypothetical protein
MPSPEAIHELVAKFEKHNKKYQSHKDETELQLESPNPLFEGLGWDVGQQQGQLQSGLTDPQSQ